MTHSAALIQQSKITLLLCCRRANTGAILLTNIWIFDIFRELPRLGETLTVTLLECIERAKWTGYDQVQILTQTPAGVGGTPYLIVVLI